MVQPHCAKAAAAGAANGLQGGSSGEKIPPAHTKNLSQHQLAPASWRDVFFGKTIDLRLRSFGTCRRTLSRIIELHVPVRRIGRVLLVDGSSGSTLTKSRRPWCRPTP